ncbi:nucleotidyl transferase AbiEii/AbiGii toxin family protein [Nocardia carnea]|uniref:Nucleotidyl transferase AbiEii/AbiGii toxin family protein n=1 Tax=Nocardia carnea TaxID=37328 RepID=A0ABW7TRU9_9NOCA|nr:nucleotidyl transferase AbiEii/AbiGii toxin family protein [Nocardia carnea]
MKRYRNGVDLRQALEIRLKREADEQSTDLGRLRRRVVFDRLAVRLAIDPENTWILKGGAALEFRLYPRARATKDIDLALAAGQVDGYTVRDLLIDAMADDVDQDWFSFQVSQPTALRADAGGREAWRFSLNAFLGGKSFAGVRLDVADRHAELAATEQLELPGMLQFAGIPPRVIEAVDRNQHFAEKLHALTKDYGDRPNTRVKDLVDLVLLIEAGLQPGAVLVAVVQHVFGIRQTHQLPPRLPDPPPLWRDQYPVAEAGLTDTGPDLAAAIKVVRTFWTAAVGSTT